MNKTKHQQPKEPSCLEIHLRINLSEIFDFLSKHIFSR